MKNTKLKSFLLSAVLLLSVILLSCEKNQLPDESIEKTAPETSQELLLKAAAVDHPGRYLAANCFNCHGTNGYAGELKIAGESTSEIISKFNSFKAQDPKANIMNLHARAYTDSEISLIADFFSKQ